MKLNILLIEDEATLREVVQAGLEKLGKFNVDTAISLAEAIQHLNNNKYDAIVCDLNLPDSEGAATIVKVRETNSKIPIVAVTGYGDENSYVQLLAAGAVEMLQKGSFTLVELVRIVALAIETYNAKQLFKPIVDELHSATKTVEELKKVPKK